MTVRNVLQYPHKSLSTVCLPVFVNPETKIVPQTISMLIANLKETAKAYEAEGIAANQIGEAYRIFVIRDEVTRDYIACLNPEVVLENAGTDLKIVEGCLSFPGVNEVISRSNDIRVKYLDETGNVVERQLTGIMAVCFQHELDHLNGKTFLDRMASAQKYLATKKHEKLQKVLARRFKRVA